MASPMQEPYVGKKCFSCGLGHYGVPNSGQEWHVVCSHCEAVHFCYQPLQHQHEFHEDGHKFKGFFGGYGSGKTTTAAAESIRHILNTPGGTFLIGAETLPQLEQTAQKEFFAMFPQEFIVQYHKQKNYLTTINGHTVIFRPLDDEHKARSLNLTGFWIEEASGVAEKYFTQLKTRLRNKATDRHLGILSSNPDLGWIKREFLLKSDVIHNSEVEYIQEETNPSYASHIAPTHLNIYLPDNYYEDTAKGQPEWWINRYLHGSFENREGLVYSTAQDHIIEPFEIPKHWERIQASDFGKRDPTVGLWGAIDPRDGTIFLYDEHYEREKPVYYHAEKFLERLSKIPPGLLRALVGDPKGKATSERDMRSLFDHYGEYGVFFTPGINKIEDGIIKVDTWFKLEKIKIFKTLKNTIYELTEGYKYPERKEDETKNPGDKPMDKDNHAADCLRYMINELPDSPEDLINESFGYEVNIASTGVKSSLPHALQEEDDGDDLGSWMDYY